MYRTNRIDIPLSWKYHSHIQGLFRKYILYTPSSLFCNVDVVSPGMLHCFGKSRAFNPQSFETNRKTSFCVFRALLMMFYSWTFISMINDQWSIIKIKDDKVIVNRHATLVIKVASSLGKILSTAFARIWDMRSKLSVDIDSIHLLTVESRVVTCGQQTDWILDMSLNDINKNRNFAAPKYWFRAPVTPLFKIISLWFQFCFDASISHFSVRFLLLEISSINFATGFAYADFFFNI